MKKELESKLIISVERGLMITISKLLDPKLITFLGVETREEALCNLVEIIHHAGKLRSKEEFLKAILDREAIISTGIGLGVAIPHAKLAGYNLFFIAIGILKKGIDWKALDDTPVRIVFMIGGPENQQTEYLQILSQLTMMINDEEIRKKLLTLNSPEAIIKVLKNF
jgi:PTS system nitrogen regulatory IIA component